MTLPGGQLLNYGYDALGRISSIGLGSGFNGPFTPVVSNLSYFPFGPLREIDFHNGVVRYENLDFEYRPDGLFEGTPSSTIEPAEKLTSPVDQTPQRARTTAMTVYRKTEVGWTVTGLWRKRASLPIHCGPGKPSISS